MASEGIELNPKEDPPQDPYGVSRQLSQNAYTTPSDYDKLKRFMQMDRKVLRFYCVWDDRDNMFGEMRPYVSGRTHTHTCQQRGQVCVLEWAHTHTHVPTTRAGLCA